MDEATNHTERVVEGAIGFFHDEVVATANDDGDSATHVFDTGNLDHLAVSALYLLDERGATELIARHLVNVRHRLAVERLADKLNLFSLDIAND